MAGKVTGLRFEDMDWDAINLAKSLYGIKSTNQAVSFILREFLLGRAKPDLSSYENTTFSQRVSEAHEKYNASKSSDEQN